MSGQPFITQEAERHYRGVTARRYSNFRELVDAVASSTDLTWGLSTVFCLSIKLKTFVRRPNGTNEKNSNRGGPEGGVCLQGMVIGTVSRVPCD
jgi:hypothetical protein